MNIDSAERARLTAELARFAGAALQKLWLPAPLLAVIELRTPGASTWFLLDARAGVPALVTERPPSPEPAPGAQALVRAALRTARLARVALEPPPENARRPPSLRVTFETPRGERSLLLEPGARARLALLDGARVLWASKPEAAAAPSEASAATSGAGLLEEHAAGALAARKAALLRTLRARSQRLRKTLAAVDTDAARAAAAEADRRKGELLLPLQSRIARGAREVTVPDWSALGEDGAPAQVTIALDPALPAAEQVARWFRRAARLQAAGPRIAARRAEIEAAIAAAEALVARAGSADDGPALAALEAAARPTGPSRAPAERTGPRLPYRAFRSSSGARILVGRSARDNDALTFRVGRGNDLWLHVRGQQGSHVVVPAPGDAPDSRTVADAAILAAHFSSARGQDGVEVAWTRCKYIRKPKGAPPGSVTHTQESTLRLRADEARLRALLASEE